MHSEATISQAGTHTRLSSLSLVFPAFNEEQNIELAVAAARRALTRYSRQFEIIVVNDGSTDRTGESIDRMARDSGDVVAIHHHRNSGYGAALLSGFRKARYDYVFFSDADLQFDLDELGHLIEWIGDFEIVAGYRAHRADPWYRKLNASAWNMVVRLTLGVRVRDVDCAFKLFQRRVLDSITPTTGGAMINAEMLALASRHRYRVKEVPVSHYPRTRGTQTGARLSVIVRAFAELARIKIRAVRTKSLAGASAEPAGCSTKDHKAS